MNKYLAGRWVSFVEVVLVGVHPDLCSSYGVLQEVGPGVRGLLREDVAHVGAGMDLERASTLPHLWKELHHCTYISAKSFIVIHNDHISKVRT